MPHSRKPGVFKCKLFFEIPDTKFDIRLSLSIGSFVLPSQTLSGTLEKGGPPRRCRDELRFGNSVLHYTRRLVAHFCSDSGHIPALICLREEKHALVERGFVVKAEPHFRAELEGSVLLGHAHCPTPKTFGTHPSQVDIRHKPISSDSTRGHDEDPHDIKCGAQPGNREHKNAARRVGEVRGGRQFETGDQRIKN